MWISRRGFLGSTVGASSGLIGHARLGRVSQSQPVATVDWIRWFDGRIMTHNCGLVRTTDGGYAVAGGTMDDRSPIGPWLGRTDPRGDPVWQFRGEDGIVTDALETNDGGILAAATGRNDAILLRIGADGTLQGRTSYGGDAEDAAYAIQPGADGTYLLLGSTLSFGSGSYSAFVQRVAPDGSPLERVVHDLDATTTGIADVVPASGDGCVTAGRYARELTDEPDVVAMGLDGRGERRWHHEIRFTNRATLGGIAAVDGGYVVAGDMVPADANETTTAWFVRVDEAGERRWVRTIEGDRTLRVNDVTGVGGGAVAVGVEIGETGAPWLARVPADGTVGPYGPVEGDVTAEPVATVAVGDAEVALAGQGESPDGEIASFLLAATIKESTPTPTDPGTGTPTPDGGVDVPGFGAGAAAVGLAGGLLYRLLRRPDE